MVLGDGVLLALGGSWRHDLLIGRRELMRLYAGRLVLAADRVLELAHAPAERAPHLGQALRAEHEQDHQEQNDELGGADSEWHAPEHSGPAPGVGGPGRTGYHGVTNRAKSRVKTRKED